MQELLLKMGGGRLRGGGVFAGFYGICEVSMYVHTFTHVKAPYFVVRL